MELTFRAAAPAERLYIAKQSTQIEGQTGSVGHLQADMGEDGKGFFPKWTSHRESLDTEDFQQEFEEVLEALVGDEQYGGFLKSRDAMRDFCRGRVIAVFGCGGDRDPMKRPIMGHIGVGLSDFAVVTSDNPRTEEPMAIIRDILKGVKQEDGEYIVIEDRRKAIRYAMDIAKKDDIIILAGKGHETYQDVGGKKHHLDEREEVAAHLSEMRK